MRKVLYLFVFLIILTGCNSNINNKEYYFEALDLNKLWEYSEGESQTIAFIDTGVSKDLEILYKDRIIDTYNSIDDSEKVFDTNGHGTQMVSIASGNGKKGIFGIAPKSKIIVIKAFEKGEQMNASYIVKAIDYAISKDVDVINMSFGSFVSNPEIEGKIKTALKNNITIVVSTGDYANEDVLFPANMDNVVSVEAKDKDGSPWDLSNVSKDDVMALPGVAINCLTLDNKRVKMSGTSYSSALASGYIALLRDYYKKNNIKFDNGEIISRLKEMESTRLKSTNYIEPFLKKE